MGEIARLPLIPELTSRDGKLFSKDSFMVNAMIEASSSAKYAVRRPGWQTLETFTAGAGQGTLYFNGFFYSVVGDVLYRSSGTHNSGTSGSAFTQANVPPWYGRGEGVFQSFNGKMYVIGGVGAFEYADVSSSSDGENWTVNAAAAPFGNRQGPGCVVFNNLMWIIGGSTPTGTYMNDVWSTPDGITWTQVTSSAPWAGRSLFGCLAANNGIYIFGGLEFSGFVSDIWFTSDGKNWTQVTPQASYWSARAAFVTLFYNNTIFVIGGQILGGSANDVWSSTTGGQTWTSLTGSAFASSRTGMAGCIYNNKMFVLGGNHSGTNLSDVYTSTNGSSWTLVTSTPGWGARNSFQAIVFQTPYTVSPSRYPTIWIASGNGSVKFQDVWYGNLNTSTLTSYTLSPTTTGQPYQLGTFNNGTQIILKNQSNFWVLSSGTLIKVVDPNYPSVTVPGLVVMNQFVYVMTPQGQIFGCGISDATTWPGAQFVYASYEDDPGVALAKHLNYVVALGQYTTQFFYDAGNPPPGIALSSMVTSNLRIGCVAAQSVANVNGTLFFIGTTPENTLGVYMMNGLQPQKISTPWVDKIIQNPNNQLTGSSVYGFGFGTEGHGMYMLCTGGAALALIYDVTFQVWYPWTPVNGVAFTTDFGVGDWYVLEASSGILRWYSTQFLNDNGTPFEVQVQTAKGDMGNMARKFYGAATLIADQNAGTPSIAASDDDYQTFTTFGTVDLSAQRPRINRLGSSRRRAWQISQTDSNPLRWEALEIEYSQGES